MGRLPGDSGCDLLPHRPDPSARQAEEEDVNPLRFRLCGLRDQGGLCRAIVLSKNKPASVMTLPARWRGVFFRVIPSTISSQRRWAGHGDRKITRLNSSHITISY